MVRLDRIPMRIFFLFVLLSLCQINFACGNILGVLSVDSFGVFGFPGTIFHGRRDFRSHRENDWKLNAFLNESMLRSNFQAELSARNFTGARVH